MVKAFWWRIGLLICFVVLELSFSSVLFPASRVPGLILNLTLALVLVRGFRESVWQWLFLLLVFDILRSGTATFFLPLGILIGYLSSFISRRFIFEHRGSGLFMLALLAGFLAGGTSLLFFLITQTPITWSVLLSDAFFTGISFYPIFLVVQWFERRLEFMWQAEFRGMRH